MNKGNFAESDDVTYYGDDSVNDYHDYYENNLNHHEHEYNITYPLSVEKEEGPTTREEKAKNKERKVNIRVKYDPQNLWTTLSIITLDLKFRNERLRVLKAQEEMFERIMYYSSSI